MVSIIGRLLEGNVPYFRGVSVPNRLLKVVIYHVVGEVLTNFNGGLEGEQVHVRDSNLRLMVGRETVTTIVHTKKG